MSDEGQFISEQQIIDAWRRALEEDHPNPDREGCLSLALLKKAARALNDLDSEERMLFVDHIGQCSPCSQELKALRDKGL